VRIDSGVVVGDAVSGAFDSMLAKLIVTGATRAQAIARARRALGEIRLVGIPTVLPFDRAVLDALDFAADRAEDFRVHTTWIENDFAEELSRLGVTPPSESPTEDESKTERVVVEVGGKRLEVVLPAGLGINTGRAGRGPVRRPRKRSNARGSAANNGTLASPMQGTIVRVAVADGQDVSEGDLVAVLEAMKMEQPLLAHRAGTVTALSASVGQSVSAGTVICEIREG